MSDQPKRKRPLSEISHLFLSSIRQKQTDGAQTPRRKPPEPAKPELAPDEMALVLGGDSQVRPVGVWALIGPHLNGKQFDHVKRYARSLAASNKRVGLIEIDASELRLMRFDLESDDGSEQPLNIECFDPRTIKDALTEMSCDLDQWLLLAPNPRMPEARALLRMADQWVLLTTCDPDGVVGAYRTLKGLAESERPALSLAILDATSATQADQVSAKLTGVCTQFLNWPVKAVEAVTNCPEVAEHLVMCCRPVKDKAQLAGNLHWQSIEEFLCERSGLATQVEPEGLDEAVEELAAVEPAVTPVAEPAAPEPVALPMPVLPQVPEAPVAAAASPMSIPVAPAVPEVIDLPANQADEGGILSAVLQHPTAQLAQTSVVPPMCPAARLAVTRDHRILLLAVQTGRNLRSIAQAFLSALDRAIQAEHDANLLQPLMQAGSVTVQTYRRLRWGGRTGLLLEAA